MENTVSIVDEACLPRRCLAIDVLLFRMFASAEICLANRCLAMRIHITILLKIDLITSLCT
jgi:hypothetical protein